MKKTLFGMLAIGLVCHAQGGEVTVKLTTEAGRLLKDEYRWNIRVAVSNGTDSAIRVVEEVGYAKNTQLFFVLLPENIMRYCVRENMLKAPHTNAWEKISTTNSWSTQHIRALAPGQTHEWDYSWLFPSIQLFAEELPAVIDQFDMYAQVLVGTNLWPVSNTNTVRFSRQKIEDGILRFTGTYQGKRRIENINVYEHTTDGDRFLFSANSDPARICKVPAGATPSFEVETGTDILKVTFSDNSPPVRFNIWEGKVIP